jgi:hypothetical protein
MRRISELYLLMQGRSKSLRSSHSLLGRWRKLISRLIPTSRRSITTRELALVLPHLLRQG